MSIQDPTEIIREYCLYPKGTIQFGYGKHTGMSVGTSPLMAKISIPEDCGLYPSDWFVLTDRSAVKIFAEIEKESIDTAHGKQYFLNDKIMLDCYQYHWQKFYWEIYNENDFLKSERERLIKKLEKIDNLSRYAWEQVKRNPQEAEEIFNMINWESK